MKLTKGRLSKIKKMKRQTRYNRKKPRKIGSRKSFRKRKPKHFLYSSLKKRRRVQKGGQDWLSGLGMALGSMPAGGGTGSYIGRTAGTSTSTSHNKAARKRQQHRQHQQHQRQSRPAYAQQKPKTSGWSREGISQNYRKNVDWQLTNDRIAAAKRQHAEFGERTGLSYASEVGKMPRRMAMDTMAGSLPLSQCQWSNHNVCILTNRSGYEIARLSIGSFINEGAYQKTNKPGVFKPMDYREYTQKHGAASEPGSVVWGMQTTSTSPAIRAKSMQRKGLFQLNNALVLDVKILPGSKGKRVLTVQNNVYKPNETPVEIVIGNTKERNWTWTISPTSSKQNLLWSIIKYKNAGSEGESQYAVVTNYNETILEGVADQGIYDIYSLTGKQFSKLQLSSDPHGALAQQEESAAKLKGEKVKKVEQPIIEQVMDAFPRCAGNKNKNREDQIPLSPLPANEQIQEYYDEMLASLKNTVLLFEDHAQIGGGNGGDVEMADMTQQQASSSATSADIEKLDAEMDKRHFPNDVKKSIIKTFKSKSDVSQKTYMKNLLTELGPIPPPEVRPPNVPPPGAPPPKVPPAADDQLEAARDRLKSTMKNSYGATPDEIATYMKKRKVGEASASQLNKDMDNPAFPDMIRDDLGKLRKKKATAKAKASAKDDQQRKQLFPDDVGSKASEFFDTGQPSQDQTTASVSTASAGGASSSAPASPTATTHEHPAIEDMVVMRKTGEEFGDSLAGSLEHILNSSTSAEVVAGAGEAHDPHTITSKQLQETGESEAAASTAAAAERKALLGKKELSVAAKVTSVSAVEEGGKYKWSFDVQDPEYFEHPSFNKGANMYGNRVTYIQDRYLNKDGCTLKKPKEIKNVSSKTSAFIKFVGKAATEWRTKRAFTKGEEVKKCKAMDYELFQEKYINSLRGWAADVKKAIIKCKGASGAAGAASGAAPGAAGISGAAPGAAGASGAAGTTGAASKEHGAGSRQGSGSDASDSEDCSADDDGRITIYAGTGKDRVKLTVPSGANLRQAGEVTIGDAVLSLQQGMIKPKKEMHEEAKKKFEEAKAPTAGPENPTTPQQAPTAGQENPTAPQQTPTAGSGSPATSREATITSSSTSGEQDEGEAQAPTKQQLAAANEAAVTAAEKLANAKKGGGFRTKKRRKKRKNKTKKRGRKTKKRVRSSKRRTRKRRKNRRRNN